MNSLYKYLNFIFKIINGPDRVKSVSKFIVMLINSGVKIIDIAVIVIIWVAFINILIIILKQIG
jgi:hypothetical protein